MIRHATAAAIALAAFTPGSNAQPYPSRQITIVVALGAGTGVDIVVRTYSEKLSQTLGRPFIVENRPGSAGMAAVDGAKKAPADGYTLVAATSAAMAIRPTMFKKPPYDPNKDFVPLAHYLKSPFVLVVNPDLPIKSIPDLITYVKAQPGQGRVRSTSIGGAPHLAGEYLNQRFGVQMTHVPYKNSPQAIQDVAAGHIQLSFADAGRVAAADPRRQAARAGGDLGLAARHAARRADVRGGLRHPRFRSGVLARAVRPRRHAAGDRRPAARRDEAHHRDPEVQTRMSSLGLIPYRAAADRGVAALHPVRDRQVGRAGRKPRPGGHDLGRERSAAAFTLS